MTSRRELASRLNNAAEGCLQLGYGTELYDLMKECARFIALSPSQDREAKLREALQAENARLRVETVERCAKVCAAMSDDYINDEYARVAAQCCDAIRVLAAGEGKQ